MKKEEEKEKKLIVEYKGDNYTLYKNPGFDWLIAVYFSCIFIFRINFVHFYRCRCICMRFKLFDPHVHQTAKFIRNISSLPLYVK